MSATSCALSDVKLSWSSHSAQRPWRLSRSRRRTWHEAPIGRFPEKARSNACRVRSGAAPKAWLLSASQPLSSSAAPASNLDPRANVRGKVRQLIDVTCWRTSAGADVVVGNNFNSSESLPWRRHPACPSCLVVPFDTIRVEGVQIAIHSTQELEPGSEANS